MVSRVSEFEGLGFSEPLHMTQIIENASIVSLESTISQEYLRAPILDFSRK